MSEPERAKSMTYSTASPFSEVYQGLYLLGAYIRRPSVTESEPLVFKQYIIADFDFCRYTTDKEEATLFSESDKEYYHDLFDAIELDINH